MLLSGCTTASAEVTPPPAATDGSPTASADASASDLSAFEEQLPLSGTFVSQATATEGSVEIQRREDGSVWIVLENFDTGYAPDLRLYLKEDELLQDADGYWGAAEGGYELLLADPGAPRQEIEVPGAWDMPEIRTLTVADYTPPDFPALGSVALD